MIILCMFMLLLCIYIRQRNVIPKVVHKIYIQDDMQIPSEIPKVIQEQHDNWKRLNPEYEHRFYSGKDCEQYLKTHFSERHLKTYLKLKPYSYKCDFMRYCIVYNEGGVYTDWKMECLKPLRTFIKPETRWMSFWDLGEPAMWTGFFAAMPGSCVLKRAIDMCIYNTENNIYGRGTLYPTGPDVLGISFSKCYPQYKWRNQISTRDIRVGNFILPSLWFKQRPLMNWKCTHCEKGQDWENGNNYGEMWQRRDIYVT